MDPPLPPKIRRWEDKKNGLEGPKPTDIGVLLGGLEKSMTFRFLVYLVVV